MLAVLSFWIVVQLIALATLPLTWRLCSRLPDRGYALAKPLGLLLEVSEKSNNVGKRKSKKI